MSKQDGGAAFPYECKYADGTAEREIGMSLRDYFAAKAMLNCLTEFWRGAHDAEYGIPPNWRTGVAIDAYRMADAMLAARNSDRGEMK